MRTTFKSPLERGVPPQAGRGVFLFRNESSEPQRQKPFPPGKENPPQEGRGAGKHARCGNRFRPQPPRRWDSLSNGGKAFIAALFLLLAHTITASAQNQVNVSTQVLPPYSPYLSDYVGFDNKVIITLTNTSQQTQSVRLVGSIKGNTGITITIPQNFIPSQPINLLPGAVKVLKGGELEEYFNSDNLQFSGISKQEVIQGNGLPEGNYDFCVRAVDYNSGEPRSLPAPSGCTNFSITHYNPPEITAPACNSTVMPSNPQNLLFAWTIPPGAPPNEVEYVLKIVEIIPANIAPAQAMASAPEPPFFEKVISSTSYLYLPSDPKLEVGVKYAVRITARDKQGGQSLNFKNNGHSVVCSFTYGGEEDLAEEEEEADQEENIDLEEEYVAECESLNCAPPAPNAAPGNHIYKAGDEVKIGYFTLKLGNLSDPSANNLSGQGTIDAPIFKVQLRATFNGLKVNPDHKVYQGKAIGAYDPGAQVDQELQKLGGSLENLAAEKVKAVSDYVKSNQKYIENFADVEAKGLPFAWKDVVDSKLQLIDVVAVEFAPDGARLNAVMEFPIPEAENQLLAFGQKNICFHPTGLSVDGLQKLTMLGNDKTFNWGPNTTMTLRKAGGNGGTFVKWDCKGFKGLQVDGYFTFSEGMLEKTNGNGAVKGDFTLNAAAWGDLLGQISIDPFTVKGMKGVQFAFNNVILDFSDTRNAQNMAFPANYNGGKGNDWRGFFFKEIKVTLPNYLKKGNTPVQITLADAFINKLGFTGTTKVEPVFTLEQGNIGGWGFSMDEFEMAFLNNSLTAGKFSGKIKLPVAQTGIAYSCLLSNSNQGVKTAFSVSNIGDVVVDMWAATLSLYDGSTLSIEAVGNDVTVQATLSGDLTIDKKFPEMKGVSVKIPNVEFQDLTIRNKAPYLSATLFKFASPEKSFAGFPVSIKPDDGIELKFEDAGKKAGLKLGFQVGLDGNGQSAISGGTAFTLWGKMVQQNNVQTWAFDKPELNKIYVKASVASCDIEGQIDLYNGDQKFGDGFRGALSVKFRPLVALSATVQFGNTDYQNGGNRYRYWFVDAMAVINAGIMVSPGFGIYGFGGGAYYHMKPVSSIPTAAGLDGDPNSAKNFNQNQAGKTSSGTTYDPAPNIAFGFKATIVMGTLPTPKAFNGDISLEASFFQGGGLNEIALSGNGYFVSDLNPKQRPAESSAIVSASVLFKYSGAQKTFDGVIDININLKAGNRKLIVGGGQAAMHFSQSKWFIKIGTPNDPIGLTVLDLLKIDSYLMIGKNSLGPIPPLPTSPINFREELPSFSEPRKSDVNSGSGFALGQQLSINTGKMKFLIFYARIAIAFGYDVSVLKEDFECAEASGTPGLNGWYARGQVYAGLEAEVGIDINLWFIKADVSLFEVGVYAALRAGLPNPTWLQGAVKGSYSALNGLLSGQCTFKFRYGAECDPASQDPFAGLKVIADLKPTGGDADVFSYPEVAFNLPVGQNKYISVEGVDQNNNIVVSTFRFGIREFSVTQIKDKGKGVNKKVSGTYAIYNNGMSALFEPNEMLAEQSVYRMSVKVYGDRLVNGEWVRITKSSADKTEHVESKTNDFTTGDAPERFVGQNIIETKPGQRQRYYYTHDGGTEGYVRFKLFPSNIKNMKPDDPNYEYRYVARYQEIGSGSQVIAERSVTWDSNPNDPKVRFGIPSSDLKKQQLYIIQIVRKKVKKGGGGASGSGSGLESYTSTTGIGDGQKINVKLQRLKSIQLGDDEFLVYQIAFKTSKYSRLADKIKEYIQGNDETLKRGEGSYSNTIYARYKGDEPFDWYDLNEISYSKGGKVSYLPPLLSAEAVDFSQGAQSNYYWASLRSNYYDWVTYPYLEDKLQTDVYINQKLAQPNPRTVRTYPPANAYLPGSRLTGGVRIPDQFFPKYAVGIRYVGNGHTEKLTDGEINAVYWKDFDPEPGAGGLVLVANKVAAPPKSNGGAGQHAMGAQNLKMNELDYIEVRYDVATVLIKDRKKVADELLSRYGLSPAYFSMVPQWWSFAKYNYPTVIDEGGENPHYWDMKFKNSSYYEVRFVGRMAQLNLTTKVELDELE